MIKGLHHVSMKCATEAVLSQALEFYRDILGLQVYRRWPGGVLLDTGSGFLEIFLGQDVSAGKGSLRHLALETDDVDGCARAVAEAGYPVFLPPQIKTFPSNPPIAMRIAFCKGPLGEEVEFFCPLE